MDWTLRECANPSLSGFPHFVNLEAVFFILATYAKERDRVVRNLKGRLGDELESAWASRDQGSSRWRPYLVTMTTIF